MPPKRLWLLEVRTSRLDLLLCTGTMKRSPEGKTTISYWNEKKEDLKSFFVRMHSNYFANLIQGGKGPSWMAAELGTFVTKLSALEAWIVQEWGCFGLFLWIQGPPGGRQSGPGHAFMREGHESLLCGFVKVKPVLQWRSQVLQLPELWDTCQEELNRSRTSSRKRERTMLRQQAQRSRAI